MAASFRSQRHQTVTSHILFCHLPFSLSHRHSFPFSLPCRCYSCERGRSRAGATVWPSPKHGRKLHPLAGSPYNEWEVKAGMRLHMAKFPVDDANFGFVAHPSRLLDKVLALPPPPHERAQRCHACLALPACHRACVPRAHTAVPIISSMWRANTGWTVTREERLCGGSNLVSWLWVTGSQVFGIWLMH